MEQLINTIIYFINFGVRLTISTGAVFQPCFQERICAVENVVQQESNKYENNYEYSSTEWTPVFKIKAQGEKNGKDIRR